MGGVILKIKVRLIFNSMVKQLFNYCLTIV